MSRINILLDMKFTLVIIRYLFPLILKTVRLPTKSVCGNQFLSSLKSENSSDFIIKCHPSSEDSDSESESGYVTMKSMIFFFEITCIQLFYS